MPTYTADLAFRDYVTDGVPSSGAHQPAKSDIRGLFAATQSYVTVEQFSTVDGTTDNSAAFTAAIATGKLIILDGSKTYVQMNATFPSGGSHPGIISLGGQARITPPAGATSSDRHFAINQETAIHFRNIFFDMPTSTSTVFSFSRALFFAPTVNFIGTGYVVDGCRFHGAGTHISASGFIVKNSRFTNNYSVGAYGDSFSFNAMIDCHIADNTFADTGIGTVGSTPSGAVRVGTTTQRDATYNLSISRNLFLRCCEATGQSIIDCFSGSASGIRIEGNIAENCGGTIELKTAPWTPSAPSTPTRAETYSDIVISHNTIRARGDRDAGGISVRHADTGNPAGKCRDIHLIGNKISSIPAFVSGSGFNSYAITVQGYDDVYIEGGKIDGFDHGVTVSGTGAPSDTCGNISISGVHIEDVGIAFQHSGGTINGLYITDSPLIRSSTTSSGAFGFGAGAVTTDFELSGNYIECLASGQEAVDLRGIDGARIFNNRILADGNAIYLVAAPMNDTQIVNNWLFSATADAVRLDVGTLTQVRNNEVDVPVARRSVGVGGGFAGTFTAAGNMRGTASASPTGAAGGALGDIFLDDTAATAGWRCTTAANTTATYGVI